MIDARMDRRAVLLGTGAALLAAGARGAGLSHAHAAPAYDTSTSFVPAHVPELAERLAAEPFSKPSITLPASFQRVSYDQYRDIRFRRDQAIWRGDKIDFELQLLPMGWLFDVPVEIWLV